MFVFFYKQKKKNVENFTLSACAFFKIKKTQKIVVKWIEIQWTVQKY